MNFREHLREKILRPSDRILEFGPLTRPTVSKDTHPNIRFADIRNSDDIKKLYSSNDYLESTGISVDLNSIVDIDYVVKGSYKEYFKGIERFDTVILSHVIEHVPDIIFFFQDVMSLLKSNGRLVIIYPDARYCFDHFRNGSSFIDAYDVFKDNNNSSKRVFDFVYNVVHENDPGFFWGNAKQNNILPKNDFNDALLAYDKALKNELPDDTHFWPFADHQLIKFLYDMDRAGLLKLDVEEFYQTQENTQEFMIILTPKTSKTIDHPTYKKILNKISPATKEIESRGQAAKLRDEIASLEAVNREINGELKAVYSSRRWKYASRMANIKSKIVDKNGKE
jgi:SAM-dependent methyltransferase